ncbi:MAG: hypothetical protein ABIQ36_05090, partial [Rhodanobacter sp.]
GVAAARQVSRTARHQFGERALQRLDLWVVRRPVAAGGLFLFEVTVHGANHHLRHVVCADIATQKTWRNGNRLFNRGMHSSHLRVRHR